MKFTGIDIVDSLHLAAIRSQVGYLDVHSSHS